MSVATVSTRTEAQAAPKGRAARDWYCEPPEAVLALFQAERFEGSIYDPACGRGTIPTVARGLGYRATGDDLAPRDGRTPRNFLLERIQAGAYDNVVCNPPFKHAEPFIERALDLAQIKVAMLLRLSFLESRRRAALFARTPLARVHVFSNRISMPPGEMLEAGTIEAKGGAVAFAWFVWEHGYAGPPTLNFIEARGGSMSNRRAAALNSKAWIRAARVEAWTQQGGLCCFCRSVLTRALVTADHRRPRSKGGTDDPRNIQAACAFCNKAKGNMSDSAFLNLLKRRPPGLPPLILFCSIVRAINLRVERAVNRIARFAR